MNEAENKIKQQVVEKIKSSTNILVTVSKDPSVDELSAAIGLTAFLNKLGKHATAIFSGVLPPAITFLEPDKVFENSANSLRDFIIALDKEKADHLRYKVDGDVVKIFITPYRTTITSDDLDFSQGDYNIELVLALGVSNQDHLDAALLAHDRQMLHDVTIATFTAGEGASKLGSIDWCDSVASGYSEMVAIISESLKTDKILVDKQIATALLTGIVSSTDRFSNPKTSSRVMTTAAQLMAAGADQQLIAAKLQESHDINSLPNVSISASEAIKDIPFVQNSEPVAPLVPASHDGSLSIAHDDTPEVPVVPEPETVAASPTLPNPVISGEPVSDAVIQAMETIRSKKADENPTDDFLDITSDQAAEAARRQLEDLQNNATLTRSYINEPSQAPDAKMIDIFSDTPSPSAPATDTLANIGLPLPPPLPDFSTLPATPALPDMGMPFPVEPLASAPVQSKPSNDPTQFQIPS